MTIAPASEAQVRTLDVLWLEAIRLNPTKLEIESPAFCDLQKRPSVTMRFTKGDDSVKLTGTNADIRLAFEEVLAKAAKFFDATGARS